jgi:hypothetical protein
MNKKLKQSDEEYFYNLTTCEYNAYIKGFNDAKKGINKKEFKEKWFDSPESVTDEMLEEMFDDYKERFL